MKRTCDNVDHDKNVPAKNVKRAMLTKDFNFDVCEWCEDCRERDEDMILKELRGGGK